jgi:hypothetical protein
VGIVKTIGAAVYDALEPFVNLPDEQFTAKAEAIYKSMTGQPVPREGQVVRVSKDEPAVKHAPAPEPTRADVFADLQKKAAALHPSLPPPQAISMLIKNEPGLYTTYTKAEPVAPADPAAYDEAWERAIGKHISAATADIQLQGLIDAFRRGNPVTKAAATVEVLTKSAEARRLYAIRASGRPTLGERESRQRAIAKASTDWDEAVAAARASTPDATESAILEKALQSPAGLEAAQRVRKHDGRASERQALLAQLHGLATQYQHDHPGVSFESAYSKVCAQGLGYHISQQLLKR